MELKTKHLIFRFIGVATLLAGIVVLDRVAGSIYETSEVRVSAQMFRSEAAPLLLNTKKLLPNIEHYYVLGAREDPLFRGEPDMPRTFRTNNL